ncbi:hypothetical protein GGD66_007953 [Bradyrhizobium sp. CIR48]|nr:hypothetical protein [Bradyrhizobium sp. CIR48]
MTANHGSGALRRRFAPEPVQIMQDVEVVPAEAHSLRIPIVPRPMAGIDIPPNRSDRRNRAQPFEHLPGTDIAGMNDMRDSVKARRHFWP